MYKININTFTSNELRTELEKLGLPTEGNKQELFAKLLKVVDPEKEREPSEKSGRRSPLPSSSIATTTSDAIEESKTSSVPENDPAKEPKSVEVKSPAIMMQPPPPIQPQHASDTGDTLKLLLLQMQGMFNQQADQFGKKFDQQNEKLDKIQETQAVQIQQLRGEINSLEEKVLKEINSRDEKVDSRFKELEDEIRQVKEWKENLSSHRDDGGQQIRTSVREPATGSARGILKPPIFDGEAPIENFKVQFEAAVHHNGWGADEQLNALILALRGKATDVLQSIPATERSYERVLRELELRYGQSHVRELCKIQLHNKRQQRGESLQDLEREVTKLARQAYGNTPSDVLSGLTVDAFINAVRDDHLKLHLRTNARGKTMNEVLTLALEYEAAKASLSSDTIKLRKLDSEDITQIRAIIKEEMGKPTQRFRTNQRRRSRSRSRCFRCQQPGHYIRDCKQLGNDRRSRDSVDQQKKREEVRKIDTEREEEGEQFACSLRENSGN